LPIVAEPQTGKLLTSTVLVMAGVETPAGACRHTVAPPLTVVTTVFFIICGLFGPSDFKISCWKPVS